MRWSAHDIRNKIALAIPEGSVIAEHTKDGHFYRIMTPDAKGVTDNVYPSVTGKLQIIKDESLINYKKNQVIQYVFKNYAKFTDANIMEHLALAERVPEDILADAGDIGTEIHDCREEIFKHWIATGVRPEDFTAFIKPEQIDIRMRSAIRALQKFCVEHAYVPVATELFVYSHKLRVAGTLDDLGLMRRVVDKGDPACKHETMMVARKVGVDRSVCVKCDYKERFDFVLMDLKTSNAFKDHYFFQVALYYWMLCELIGIRPDRCFILKVSKEDGTYKIEDLKRPAMLASYSRSMIRTHNGIMYIRGIRRDNQKIVAEKIEL